jgi:hypothetical protein
VLTAGDASAQRTLSREPQVIKQFKEYPSDIQRIMEKLRRAGLEVMPYNAPQPALPNHVRTSLKRVLVNRVLCTIQLRPALKFRPNGREYARVNVGREIRRAQIAVFGVRRGRAMKLHVVPTAHLRNVSSVYIPSDGKYAVGTSKKPIKDWTRYEEAWHLLRGVKLRTNSDLPGRRFTHDDRRRYPEAAITD